MATLADFAPHVAPFVPSCPTITVEIHLRAALAEFCAATRCWRHVATVANLAPLSRIAVPVPPGAVIHAIEKAWHNGVELEAAEYASFDPADLAATAPQSRKITQMRPSEVALVPRAESGTLRASLFLKPSVAPSGKATLPGGVYDPEVYAGVYVENNVAIPGILAVPEFILEQHGVEIGHGAVARIQFIPGQTWTDPDAAATHRAIFQQAMDQSFAVSVTGQQRAPLRSRPSFF